MSILGIGAIGLIALGNVAVAFTNLKAAIVALRLPRLSDIEPRMPPGPGGGRRDWPSLSVVVAACNEAETIGAAARQLLQVDYPDLEIIIVNDRSTDGTGAIIDRLAAGDARIVPVHVAELPGGWLGKVNAMHQGTLRARGEFVLYTDADVHFKVDALRRAIALCETRRLDHLAVMPWLKGKTLAVQAVIASFGVGYLTQLPIADIGREDSDAFAGVGAFGLVRRSTFDRSEGWEWLKMELGDDVALGMMMVQEAGGKSMLAAGGDLVAVEWYADVPALVRGLEKNGYAVLANLQWGRVALFVIVFPLIALTPFAAFLVPIPGFWLLGAGALSTLPVLALVFRRVLHHHALATAINPIGIPVLAWVVARSTWITLRRGGIRWRGTFYPLDQIRAGRRLEFWS